MCIRDSTEGSWTETLNGADVVINLAGRSVNCRYNLRNRTEIYNSRILTTRLLGQVFSRLASPPRLWMNASTATIYRHSIDQPMDEASGELGGYELVSPGPVSYTHLDVYKRQEVRSPQRPK